ncbi:MAG: hypothetical protein KDH95_09250 [Calditrichaeota bacterium]|nr:hypothetical protein [Calditrichota bacterium]MCB0268339.1 hypothetical protein [Calditrichota bacterium]
MSKQKPSDDKYMSVLINGEYVKFRIIQCEQTANGQVFHLENPEFGKILWKEEDDTEYFEEYKPKRPLFDFDFEKRKHESMKIKSVKKRIQYWEEVKNHLLESQDYYYYKNLQARGYGLYRLHPRIDNQHMIKIKNDLMRQLDNSSFVGQNQEVKDEIRRIAEILHTTLHEAILAFMEKVEQEISENKIILETRGNWEGALYELALTLREDYGNKNSFNKAYEIGAEKYLWNGEEITPQQIKKAYDSYNNRTNTK